jgi:hypothetical protein
MDDHSGFWATLKIKSSLRPHFDCVHVLRSLIGQEQASSTIFSNMKQRAL